MFTATLFGLSCTQDRPKNAILSKTILREQRVSGGGGHPARSTHGISVRDLATGGKVCTANSLHGGEAVDVKMFFFYVRRRIYYCSVVS